jgi:hypothetical protein
MTPGVQGPTVAAFEGPNLMKNEEDLKKIAQTVYKPKKGPKYLQQSSILKPKTSTSNFF